MGKRIFSTVLLWLIIFAALWWGRTVGAMILLAVMSAFTLREFYRMRAGAGRAPFTKMGMLFGALITAGPWIEQHTGRSGIHLLAIAALLACLRILSEREPAARVDALASTLFGWFYVAFLLSYLTRIITPLPGDAISADGRLLLCVWTVAVAKFCDTGALLSGMAFGRHPMAPKTSPKKTWEGAVGGVIVAAGIGALVAWLARSQLGGFLPPGRAALAALPVAAIAIISDLIESMIKRQSAIKDSGTAIPGIGGVFDVTDSLILAAPVAYIVFGVVFGLR